MVFFVDGRVSDLSLNMADARGFFQESRMPDGFHRAKAPMGLNDIGAYTNIIFQSHPIQPGVNEGIGNYVPDPASANLSELCLLYTNFVNNTVRSLYPSPTGILRDALDANLNNFFSALEQHGCTQFFPWG
jgi:unspecific peroxygenase